VPTVFLTVDEVLDIHRDQVERYGGDLSIRDMGLLESAVALPATEFDGQQLHANIFEMAAAYLFHITQNHPFVDGNKRTGAASALVFLLLNAVEVTADEEQLEVIVWNVACGQAGKQEIAEFLKGNSRAGEPSQGRSIRW
jgi:death on curing protein